MSSPNPSRWPWRRWLLTGAAMSGTVTIVGQGTAVTVFGCGGPTLGGADTGVDGLVQEDGSGFPGGDGSPQADGSCLDVCYPGGGDACGAYAACDGGGGSSGCDASGTPYYEAGPTGDAGTSDSSGSDAPLHDSSGADVTDTGARDAKGGSG